MNVPLRDDLYPQSTPIGGNKKSLFSVLKSQKNSTVPPCSPIITKELVTSINKEENNINMYSKSNYRPQRGNKGNKKDINGLDNRLESESFRDDVRLVLKDLGLPNNMRSFKEYNPIINWEEYADNIRHPRWLAIVDIIGSKQTLGIDLFGQTPEEAKKTLDGKYYKFIRWF